MGVLWLTDADARRTARTGGKGASLAELQAASLPVPSGFILTADTFRSFLESAGIEETLSEILTLDARDDEARTEAAERARSLVLEADCPDAVAEEILEAYDEFDDSPAVAVRSSATAEDLPDASFAGQQDTFLNITREALLGRVQECWASLFTDRAIYYRQRQGYDHDDVDIAVVVQRMADAEKSGVMFTRDPSTGEPELTIEAAWGLGEAVVSGTVSPDSYVLDRADRSITQETIATKNTKIIRDPETGETVERPVSEQRSTERVLDADEITALAELAEEVEAYFECPQDVEWAIEDGAIRLLQSRPITTIDNQSEPSSDAVTQTAPSVTDGSGPATATGTDGGETQTAAADQAHSSEPELITGLGGSPGSATGTVRVVGSLDELDRVGTGDLIVTEMTTPDMVHAMERAGGIVTDEGGITCHAAIVSRELGVPAVVGSGSATAELEDGQQVTIDGNRGTVTPGGSEAEHGDAESQTESQPEESLRPTTPVKPMTATEVKVNVSMPAAAERAAATGADGVGLLRMEHVVLSLGTQPEGYIADQGKQAYVDELVSGLQRVVDEFYPRPVRVRTLDAPTDEFRRLEGGDDEPAESNPMLGYRGIRRSLDKPETFECELSAFARLYEMGYDNLEIMFPLVIDADDVYAAKRLMTQAGIDPDRRTWGVMVETPASALGIESIVETGIDFASFGTNDLTQYTLSIDRNNERVADRYDECHPTVLSLIADTIECCREHDVKTSICGEAGSRPQMVEHLATSGVTSISANIDAVRDVQHEVKRVEQRLLLDSIR